MKQVWTLTVSVFESPAPLLQACCFVLSGFSGRGIKSLVLFPKIQLLPAIFFSALRFSQVQKGIESSVMQTPVVSVLSKVPHTFKVIIINFIRSYNYIGMYKFWQILKLVDWI